MQVANPEKYQRGGEYYNKLAQQFSIAAAEQIAAAARTGDQPTLNDALAVARNDGTRRDDSFYSALADQLYNEPLGAPLEQAGKVLSNTGKALGDSAKRVVETATGNWGLWIVGLVVIGAAFFYFGGGEVVRRRLR